MEVYIENILGTSVDKISLDTSSALGIVFVLNNGTKIRISSVEDNSRLNIDGDGKLVIEPRAANCVWIGVKP
jgi:hypothetical protein